MKRSIRQDLAVVSRTPHCIAVMAHAAAGLALCAGAPMAAAQQVFYTYTGPLDGLWNAPGNWTPAGIPGTGPRDVATIPPSARCAFSTVGPISRAVDKLIVGAGGQLEMGNDFDLYVRGQSDGTGTTGLLTVPGTLVMSSIGNTTDLIIAGGTFVTFGGGAPLTPALIEMGNNSQNRIYGSNGNERLDLQPGAVIRGSGQVGLNLLAIVNEGTIEARGSTGLTIDPNSAGLTNTGTLRAHTGPLSLVNGAFDNTNGDIIAGGADVALVNCDVTGGVLDTTGAGGVVRVAAAGGGTVLHAITNEGVFRMPNDSDISAYQTITNNGTLEMASIGNATDIYMAASLTLAGSGVLQMSNSAENRIYDASGNRGFVLSNSGTHTIIGSGQIGLNAINVVNQSGATILAQGTTGLYIDPPVSLTNFGTLGAVSGGRLYLSYGTFTMNAPAIAQSGGTIYLNGGEFVGTFGSVGTGECRINTYGGASLLRDLINTGTLNIYNDFDAALSGTLTNSGTISMQSIGNGTDLYLNSSVALNGPGSLTMSNSAENRILDSAGNRGFILTNSSTITGSGQIGLNSIDLVNQPGGVITASGTTGLYIDPAASVTNLGVLRAQAGSRIEFRAGNYTFTSPATAAHDATIAFNGGTYTGQITTQGTGVCRVISYGGATVFSNIINLGRLDLNNDNDVYVVNTLDNRGTINMNSIGNGTDMYIGSDVLLVGGGTIAMSNSNQNNIYDPAGDRGFTFTNSANSITGAGRIAINTLSVVNGANGSIVATLPSGFEFDPSSTFTNNGVLRAENGSLLRFNHATYQLNTPATAGDGGYILLVGGTFSGIFNSEGSGEVRSTNYGANSILTNITNNGTIALLNDFDLGVVGQITNNGTFAMRSIGNGTDLYVLGHTTFSGIGALTMSNSLENRIFDPSGSRGFTFTIAQPIVGAGHIGINTINIVNAPQGRIEAASSAGINIDAATTFSNQGILRASGGNIGIQPTTFTNTGSIIADAGRLIQFNSTLLQTAGVTIANGEVQVDNDSLQLEGGLIIGTGRVDSTVTNTDGIVSPGTTINDPPTFGILTIEGNFNQSETGETLIELGGPTVGTQYDRVAVTGVANTGGVLRIRLVDGYSPVLGTTYDILTAASIAGGYDTIVAENIPFNNQLSLSILTDRIRVVFDIRCLGDYDGDGGVTGGDIAAFFEDFEAGSASADLDQDGGITGADIGEFFSRFEAGC